MNPGLAYWEIECKYCTSRKVYEMCPFFQNVAVLTTPTREQRKVHLRLDLEHCANRSLFEHQQHTRRLEKNSLQLCPLNQSMPTLMLKS